MKKILLFLGLSSVCLAQKNPYGNWQFQPKVLTATAQTSTAVNLVNARESGGNFYVTGVITLTGTGLTTATFGVLGSSNGGVTFFPINIYPVLTPGTGATTTTATTNGMYTVNLSGLTHIEFVTSGTFTGTSISLQLTATPNGIVSRNSCVGGQNQITTNLFAVIGTCNSSLEGSVSPVTDSTTNTWGATVTGGGALRVLAYCDGTNWTVMGN